MKATIAPDSRSRLYRGQLGSKPAEKQPQILHYVQDDTVWGVAKLAGYAETPQWWANRNFRPWPRISAGELPGGRRAKTRQSSSSAVKRPERTKSESGYFNFTLIEIFRFHFNEPRGKCVSSACLGRNAPERGRSTRACDRILFVQVARLRP